MRLFVSVFMLCFATVLGAAETAKVNQIPVSGHGTLEIPLPSGWTLVHTNQTDKPSLVEIHAPGNQIAMQITTYWDGFAASSNAPTEAQFENMISNVVSIQYVPASTEKKIDMEKLKGPGVTGRFVRFTDARWFAQKKPEGEFNNVTTGMFRCGNLWGHFNLLTNDKNGPDFKQGLRVLESLRRKSDS